MVGNTTFLIGTEDKDIPRLKSIIDKYSRTRTHRAATTESFGRGFSEGALQQEVTVGGATVFVLSVDSMDKY